MITEAQYFGWKINHADATDERKANAVELLKRVNSLIEQYESGGKRVENDPDTKTQISGSKGGAGDGGFRLSLSATGKPGSAHKEGMAVDIFDPGNNLDGWITRDILIKYGLYREASPFTPLWTHLQTREPKSGNRSFIP